MVRTPLAFSFCPVIALLTGCASDTMDSSWPSLSVRPWDEPSRCAIGAEIPSVRTPVHPRETVSEADEPPVPAFEQERVARAFTSVRADWEALAASFRRAAAGSLERQLTLGRLESTFLEFAALEAELAAYRREFAAAAAFRERAPEAAALWKEFQAFRERHAELVSGTAIAVISPPGTGCSMS